MENFIMPEFEAELGHPSQFAERYYVRCTVGAVRIEFASGTLMAVPALSTELRIGTGRRSTGLREKPLPSASLRTGRLAAVRCSPEDGGARGKGSLCIYCTKVGKISIHHWLSNSAICPNSLVRTK